MTTHVAHERPDAPNVVMVVLDNLGFADFGCYGSPVSTPHVDALASLSVRHQVGIAYEPGSERGATIRVTVDSREIATHDIRSTAPA